MKKSEFKLLIKQAIREVITNELLPVLTETIQETLVSNKMILAEKQPIIKKIAAQNKNLKPPLDTEVYRKKIWEAMNDDSDDNVIINKPSKVVLNENKLKELANGNNALMQAFASTEPLTENVKDPTEIPDDVAMELFSLKNGTN